MVAGDHEFQTAPPVVKRDIAPDLPVERLRKRREHSGIAAARGRPARQDVIDLRLRDGRPCGEGPAVSLRRLVATTPRLVRRTA